MNRYMEGWTAAAVILESHKALGIAGDGVQVVQGVALDLLNHATCTSSLSEGGVQELRVAQGMADAAREAGRV